MKEARKRGETAEVVTDVRQTQKGRKVKELPAYLIQPKTDSSLGTFDHSLVMTLQYL